MGKKICNKCKQNKNTDEFYKDSSKKDGLMYWCKECNKNSSYKPKEMVYFQTAYDELLNNDFKPIFADSEKYWINKIGTIIKLTFSGKNFVYKKTLKSSDNWIRININKTKQYFNIKTLIKNTFTE